MIMGKSGWIWQGCYVGVLYFFLTTVLVYGQPVKQPNVVFILVDDLRPELGCYGKAYAKTPNIDQLAASGVLFNRHYVAVPTCGASRAALLTGRYPRKAAELTNEVLERKLSERLANQNGYPETFIEQFRKQGYYTVGLGKVSHAADGYVYRYQDSVSTRKELPNSWDELLYNAGRWKTGWNAFFGYADGSDRNHRNGAVMPFEAADVPDEGYPDGLLSAMAVEKLNQLAKQGRPFFMGIGFFKPHLPFNAPKKYWDLYDPAAIPSAPFTDLPLGVSTASLQVSGEFNGYKAGLEKAGLDKSVSPSYAQTLRHAYLACVSYVDAQIGKVLEALRQTGLDKNTIIVLWGDHGWHLGDHRVWGKHTLSEWSLHSPLILSIPGNRAPVVRREIVSTIDLYPTLMELCRLPVPDSLDGRSLLPLISGRSSQKPPPPAFGFFNKGVTMRTDRYRITRYQREQLPVVELYDHQADPSEHQNIAQQKPALVRRLLKQMQTGSGTGLFR